jgi:Spy/CpxP family protein refolding chaperone
MKKRSLILGTAVLLAVLVAVPFAYAQHRRAHGLGMGAGEGMRGGAGRGELGTLMMLGHLEHARGALGLSDQQVDDIKGAFRDLRQQNSAYRAQLHDGYKGIAAALIADPNNVAAAQALLEKQEAAEHAMRLNALNAAAKALSVLTPDQRTKLADHIRERSERFQAK